MIAKEGWPFIAISGGASLLVFWLFGGGVLFAAGLILTAFVIYFFRDPDRKAGGNEQDLVSPADGKVIAVEDFEDERYLKTRVKKVSIFLSIFDVHVNRVPVSGVVRDIIYRSGRFLIGYAPKASLDNEQNAVVLETKNGTRLAVIQIAGMVARRILCYLKAGDSVTRGGRFGLIRFGSRVDLYLPLTTNIKVVVGQRVYSGETIIGSLP